MKNINKIILEGNIGKDAEVRAMNGTSKLVSFPLATTKRWKDRASKEQKERTTWHKVVVFDAKLVDIAEKIAKKGNRLSVVGELQKREWQVEGQQKTIVEVIAKEIEVAVTEKKQVSTDDVYGAFEEEAIAAEDKPNNIPSSGGAVSHSPQISI